MDEKTKKYQFSSREKCQTQKASRASKNEGDRELAEGRDKGGRRRKEKRATGSSTSRYEAGTS